MSLQYVTPDGTLIVPGAYATWKPEPNNAGLATTGVVLLVGEADSGPSYAEEGNELYKNSFGPDAKADVVAKYVSGPVVDAYNMVVTASADPNIAGSVNRVIIAKTNTGDYAASSLTGLASADGTFAGGAAGSAYANLYAKQPGSKGNLISRTVTAETAESLPTTGAFCLCSAPVATNVTFRVNGLPVATAGGTASFAQYDTPTTMVAAINALTGVTCTGGATRGTLVSTGTVTLVKDSAFACHFTGTFLATPVAGDILVVKYGSGFSAGNEGTYVIQAATSSRIDAIKVRDADADSLSQVTGEPATIGSSTDMVAYSPVIITLEAGTAIAGLGKTLEIADTSTGTFSDLCYTNGSAPAKATFTSTTVVPYAIPSTAEYRANVNFTRQMDQVNQTLTLGGNVIMTLGYIGTSASAEISGSTMTLTLVGGSSESLSPISLDLTNYITVNDLCGYLNTLGGFTAGANIASLGSMSPLNLDDGVYTFASEKGAKTGRIKADGYYVASGITYDSTLADVEPVGANTKLNGLPQASAASFFAGGSKGGTTSADIQGAFDALKDVNGNFLVPLFSNDATTDIATGQTAATSSYTIAGINASARAHVLQSSAMKAGKPRQAFLSCWTSFNSAKEVAGNLAQPRCVTFFQKIKDVDASGVLKTWSPWALAVKAAGMQAAGGYRDMTGKFVNISGLIDPSGYNNQSLSKREDALLAGLCPVIHEEDGGYTFVSDQTTYSFDSNFVFNSFQAVYAADTVAMTAQKRMGKQFKGASLADVNAAVGLSALRGILDELRQAKYIAPSADAPAGYKNLSVKILNGNTMVCSGEIKVATGIKFIPISFLVTSIQDSATG